MNKKIALDNLKDLDIIFRETNSEYWICCGTLLGFYRDNDFIGHDTDTDVCINIDSLNNVLIEKILKKGFKITQMFGRYHDGFELTINRNGVKTDLFFFYKKKNYWYHSVYSDFTQIDSLKHDYVFKPFGLKDSNFLGYNFITPDNIELVLIEQYGEDWRVPNKNWSWFKSPKNIVDTNKRVLKVDTKSDFNNI